MAFPDFSVPPQGEEITFLHTVFCAAGLPRRRFAGREFMRVNGAASLTVQAGHIDEGAGIVARDVPHGVMPRLLLAWLTSQVAGSSWRQSEIDLGDTPRELLRQLGLEGQGARYDALRKSLFDLAAAKFTFGWRGRTSSRILVRELAIWGSPGGARLVLSEDFLGDLRKHAVPLDHRALIELSGSAFALDLYLWLAQRLPRLQGALPLSWESLRLQLGQEFQGLRPSDDFRKKAAPALREVLKVYPAARVQFGGIGVELLPSDPPVGRT